MRAAVRESEKDLFAAKGSWRLNSETGGSTAGIFLRRLLFELAGWSPEGFERGRNVVRTDAGVGALGDLTKAPSKRALGEVGIFNFKWANVFRFKESAEAAF